jgi:hypothetical protein
MDVPITPKGGPIGKARPINILSLETLEHEAACKVSIFATFINAMCEVKMEIQVSNPKIVTMSTLALDQPHGLQLRYQYLNTVAEAWKMFMYDTRANAELMARATMGTPRLSVLAIIDGAACWSAWPYRVLDAMYRSEFAAEIINIKMHPFRNPRRTASTLFPSIA